jgi:hypothetical protein
MSAGAEQQRSASAQPLLSADMVPAGQFGVRLRPVSAQHARRPQSTALPPDNEPDPAESARAAELAASAQPQAAQHVHEGLRRERPTHVRTHSQ